MIKRDHESNGRLHDYRKNSCCWLQPKLLIWFCRTKTYHDYPRSDIARERKARRSESTTRHQRFNSCCSTRVFPWHKETTKEKRSRVKFTSPSITASTHFRTCNNYVTYDLEHSPGTFSHTAPEHPLGKRGPDESENFCTTREHSTDRGNTFKSRRRVQKNTTHHRSLENTQATRQHGKTAEASLLAR